MCDYSLINIPNRLAKTGEDLVTHRFPTGSLGLASPVDLAAAEAKETARPNVWMRLRRFFTPPQNAAVPAVCIPPGARLLLQDIPPNRQDRWQVSEVEEVAFTQVTLAVGHFRDAIRFSNGCQILFQELIGGQRVRVLDVSCEEPAELDVELGSSVWRQEEALTRSGRRRDN